MKNKTKAEAPLHSMEQFQAHQFQTSVSNLVDSAKEFISYHPDYEEQLNFMLDSTVVNEEFCDMQRLKKMEFTMFFRKLMQLAHCASSVPNLPAQKKAA